MIQYYEELAIVLRLYSTHRTKTIRIIVKIVSQKNVFIPISVSINKGLGLRTRWLENIFQISFFKAARHVLAVAPCIIETLLLTGALLLVLVFIITFSIQLLHLLEWRGVMVLAGVVSPHLTFCPMVVILVEAVRSNQFELADLIWPAELADVVVHGPAAAGVVAGPVVVHVEALAGMDFLNNQMIDEIKRMSERVD